MENKYITVAYNCTLCKTVKKTLVEEATAEHPFQFISGLGPRLNVFESEVAALNKGDKFDFVIPSAEATEIYARRCTHCIQRYVHHRWCL